MNAAIEASLGFLAIKYLERILLKTQPYAKTPKATPKEIRTGKANIHGAAIGLGL